MTVSHLKNRSRKRSLKCLFPPESLRRFGEILLPRSEILLAFLFFFPSLALFVSTSPSRSSFSSFSFLLPATISSILIRRYFEFWKIYRSAAKVWEDWSRSQVPRGACSARQPNWWIQAVPIAFLSSRFMSHLVVFSACRYANGQRSICTDTTIHIIENILHIFRGSTYVSASAIANARGSCEFLLFSSCRRLLSDFVTWRVHHPQASTLFASTETLLTASARPASFIGFLSLFVILSFVPVMAVMSLQ